MTIVAFEVAVPLERPGLEVWQALIDWESHGRWIPATRSRILDGDGRLGTTFEAVSGFRPLVLVDRMRVTAFDEEGLRCAVEKLGPVLTGTAGFTVRAHGSERCTVDWNESVEVPVLPQALAPIAAALGARMFAWSLRKLARQLA